MARNHEDMGQPSGTSVDRGVSSNRPGGSEEQNKRYDGSERVGAATGASTRPPYAIMILAVVAAVVILGLLVLLLSR